MFAEVRLSNIPRPIVETSGRDEIETFLSAARPTGKSQMVMATGG
jgi:hypothetical protein